MSGTVICPDCKGNGYMGDSKQECKQQNCNNCKNQGEIPITDDMIWETLQFNTGRKQ
jgi:DnaJ-class molecular chaperone